MSDNKTNIAVPTMNLSQLKSRLQNFYDVGQPLYLWGRPSSGKTSIVREFAKEEAARQKLTYSEDTFGPDLFTLKIITLSQFDSPDLRGMPEITGLNNERTTTFVPTGELPREGQGILFFDEMNQA